MNRSLKMADDINDRKKADIQRHYLKLVKEIPTHDILPHLSQCLFPSDMQSFTSPLRNESNESVNMKLLEILQYRRYWWIHLSNALIRIERPDLLVAMGWSTEIQTADQGADTSRRVHDSTTMADDINDRKKADIRRHHSMLVTEIPTHDILPHLSQCLFSSDMQMLTRGLRNESNESVNTKLLEILPYRRYWWIHLSNALIHIGRPDLLVAMDWSTEIQTLLIN